MVNNIIDTTTGLIPLFLTTGFVLETGRRTGLFNEGSRNGKRNSRNVYGRLI